MTKQQVEQCANLVELNVEIDHLRRQKDQLQERIKTLEGAREVCRQYPELYEKIRVKFNVLNTNPLV